MNHDDIELPPRIAALPRDKRGYPVPHIVMRDQSGEGVFAVNDVQRVVKAIEDGLCHICGQELGPNPWFVGGAGSWLLNGDVALYHDGPMHHECMTFALEVCPHLLGRMTKPVPDSQKAGRLPGVALVDTTSIPGTPELFIAVQAYRFNLRRSGVNVGFAVPKPTRKTEFWRGGVMLPRDEGEKAAKRAARKLATGGI